MKNVPAFDLTLFVEKGGDWSTVRLWRIYHGDPINSPAKDPEPTYIQAVSVAHAVAIAEWLDLSFGYDEPRFIYSVEAVCGYVNCDPRFAVSKLGFVELPKFKNRE